MDQVPLSGRVIFSDWHGVLSRDPFWTSIRDSATHPLHEQLEAGMAGVFDPARDIAGGWMKGLLSSDQVIAQMGIQLRGRFTGDFLARRLDLDCARMKVNVALFEVLRVIRAEAMVVIATDNMDCFARAFERARSRRRRPGRRETLADWAVICDDIICSSQAGTLKSEDPQAFFGPGWTRTGSASPTPCSSMTARTTARRSPARGAPPSSGRWAPATSGKPPAPYGNGSMKALEPSPSPRHGRHQPASQPARPGPARPARQGATGQDSPARRPGTDLRRRSDARRCRSTSGHNLASTPPVRSAASHRVARYQVAHRSAFSTLDTSSWLYRVSTASSR